MRLRDRVRLPRRNAQRDVRSLPRRSAEGEGGPLTGDSLRIIQPASVPSSLSPAHRHPIPLVFAHRGGRELGPENTIEAFDRGVAAGAEGLELDVHLSADGVAVVHHDAELDRCTNRQGPLAALTAAALRDVDAAWSFDERGGFPLRGRGIGVPALADVLGRYPAIAVIVEIKAATAETAHAVVGAIHGARAIDRVCVGSFSQIALDAVRALDPHIATSASSDESRRALYRSWCGAGIRRRPPYRAFQVPEHAGRLTVVTPQFIRAVHGRNLPIQVWTVNAEADMRRLLDWGVDGLITDRPDLAVAVRDAWVRARHGTRT
jgi:glycerophosphoryl diester phosphodiesterase